MMLLGISPQVLWVEIGIVVICAAVIGLVALSMRNPKDKK